MRKTLRFLSVGLVPCLFLLGTLFSFNSAASVEVECLEDGCHGELGGYTTTYTQNNGRRVRTTTFCAENCMTEGWNEYYRDRVISRVECLGDSCFEKGWEQYTERGNRAIRVDCRRDIDGVQSCNENGWVMRDLRTGHWVRSKCLYGDCFQFGWDIFSSNGQLLKRARCTGQDCRFQGWIIRP